MTRQSKKQTRARRHSRVRAKIAGTANRPRLAVFRSNKHLYAQLVDDETGKVLAQASDLKIKPKKTGVDLARKVGQDIAEQAKGKKISAVVFDRGGYKYHGTIEALAQEVRQQGLSF